MNSNKLVYTLAVMLILSIAVGWARSSSTRPATDMPCQLAGVSTTNHAYMYKVDSGGSVWVSEDGGRFSLR